MPKLTNRLNLPVAIARAVANDPYDGGGADYSATTLIKPARIVALEREHREEITEDVSERIYSLLGQVIHGILERAGEDDSSLIVEERFFATIGDVSISAQIDLYLKEEKHLQDYKLLTAYKIKYGQAPKEYVEQLNIQAFLMRLAGHPVEKASLNCILRDWSKLQAKREAGYPQNQVVIVEVPLWTLEKQLDFIEMKIAMHEEAKKNLPSCSDEDRWAKAPTFAIMKGTNKRAVKLMQDRDGAHELAAIFGKDHRVEERPGSNPRCENYCSVSKWCSQYQAIKAAQGSGEPTDEE